MRRRRISESGSGLFEVAIAATLTVLLVGASISVFQGGQRTFTQGATESAMRAEATRLLDSIVSELAECGATTASVAAADAKGGPYLTVQRCVGVTGSTIDWSAPITIGFRNDASAIQGTSVSKAGIEISTAGSTKLLGANLAPSGLQVSVSGPVVTLVVDLERPIAGKPPVRVSATRKVRLEN